MAFKKLKQLTFLTLHPLRSCCSLSHPLLPSLKEEKRKVLTASQKDTKDYFRRKKMQTHPFRAGTLYHRRKDIHAPFKGQQYGGIATPANAPYVFLFTGVAGEEFGYIDAFQADGLYWYSGEGQTGDMQMIKGNAAILHHQANHKSLLLFEAAHKAHVRFVGEMRYVDHHWEARRDKANNLRKSIVFHLEYLANSGLSCSTTTYAREPAISYGASSKKLDELREKALDTTPDSASIAERLVNIRARSKAIKAYALMRAAGRCEGCLNLAPFETQKGPFLEVHHVDRLADGGPDLPNQVIALCPNCHRQAHYAKDAAAYNQSLKQRLLHIEPQ